MFPGVDPRQMRGMMKKLGMREEKIDAIEVVVKLRDKELVFKEPQLSKIVMMGQETYQLIGSPVERSIDSTPEISEEDIQTVVEQTGVDKETAEKTLKETKGDIAEAIMKLQ